MTTTHAPATLGSGRAAGGSAVAEVLAAVAKRWPTLSIVDLGSVRDWVLSHQASSADVLISHLCSDDLEGDPGTGDLTADPRVHLAIRMAAPVGRSATPDRPSSPQPSQAISGPQIVQFPSGRSAATVDRWVDAPHELIGSSLSDGAVQVWLVLGSVPAVDAGFRSVAPGWIARRAGWDCDAPAAERRVRRATTELADLGWLALGRESLGGGRSRPTYHRLRQPRRAGYERLGLDVLQLRPALLRSWLRWSLVMGHRGETGLALRELADRWQISVKQLRRQLAALIDAGLLAVDDDSGRIVKSYRRTELVDDVPDLDDWPEPSAAEPPAPAPTDGFQAALPLALQGTPDWFSATPESQSAVADEAVAEPVDNPPDKNVPAAPDGTFLSGGMGHFCPPKEVHTGERHTLLGTSVPNVEDARAREVAARQHSDALQSASGSSAAEPPIRRQSRRNFNVSDDVQLRGTLPSHGRDVAEQEARQILRRFLWLRRAPGHVPHMIRAVIAAQIRRGLTADEITTAIAQRVAPGEIVAGGHVAVVRDVLRGVWADRKAAPTNLVSDQVLPQLTEPAEQAAGEIEAEWAEIVAKGPAGAGLAAAEWLEAVLAPDTNTPEPDLNAGVDDISTWFTRANLPSVLESAPVVAAGHEVGESVGTAVTRCFQQQTEAAAARYEDQPAVLAALETSLRHVRIAFGPDQSGDTPDSRLPGGWA